jgi:hypothetical protein
MRSEVKSLIEMIYCRLKRRRDNQDWNSLMTELRMMYVPCGMQQSFTVSLLRLHSENESESLKVELG